MVSMPPCAVLPLATIVAVIALSADARAQDAHPTHARRFADSYARLNDAQDVYAAVRAVQANGTADEKGWAANALSTCTFTAIANVPVGLSTAGVQDWQADKAEAKRRCAGVAAMQRADYKALGDELRTAGHASTSELGRLWRIGATSDGLDFRPATHDELATLTAALYDDDTVVRNTAANVMAGLIEQAAGRTQSLEFLAVAAPSSRIGALGRLDAIFECLTDGWCEHTHGDTLSDTWRTPRDATQTRLQHTYSGALADGRSMDYVLKIR